LRIFTFTSRLLSPARASRHPSREAVEHPSLNESNRASFLSGGNLSTAITALSGVQLSDFDTVASLSFNISIELTEYPRASRQDDERVWAEAVLHGEAVMDLIR
jgi:hypothetical protein